jgi:plastocyanin
MNLRHGPRTARPQGSAASLRLLLVVGMVVTAGSVAGCAGGSTGASAPTSSAESSLGRVTTGADGVQQVTLRTQDDYVFTPDHFTVRPGPVRVTVKNVAKQLTHNFRFTPATGPAPIAAQIPILAPGQSKSVDFTVQTGGDYPFECSFHVQLGQVGTMTVSG